MSGLDERVRAYYRAERLVEERLNTLLDIAAGSEHSRSDGAEKPAQERRARAPWWLGLAATVLVAFGIGVVGQRGQLRAERVQALAAEIALNHHKGLELDVSTDRYESLAVAMPLLDFTPLAPESLREEAYRLQGARYCSIGGSIAAQIRLLDASGQRATLYELRAPDVARGIDRVETEVDGLRVSLWREGGLLLGLARPVGER